MTSFIPKHIFNIVNKQIVNILLVCQLQVFKGRMSKSKSKITIRKEAIIYYNVKHSDRQKRVIDLADRRLNDFFQLYEFTRYKHFR